MKWSLGLLWSQLALVVASLGVAVGAVLNNRFGMVLSLSVGALPLLLVVGAVLGLVAVRRRQSFVPAAIGLLAPGVWVMATGFSDEPAGGAGPPDLTTGYLPFSQYDMMRRELESALAWLNWIWWLNLAAAALGVVSALLLFRQARAGQAA